MPSLLRLAPTSLRAAAPPTARLARPFSASALRPSGKESKLHNENRPDEAEQLKQEQLRKQKEGKGTWHEGLASDSESAVKADRGDQADSKKSIKEMQKDTADQAEKEKRS